MDNYTVSDKWGNRAPAQITVPLHWGTTLEMSELTRNLSDIWHVSPGMSETGL